MRLLRIIRNIWRLGEIDIPSNQPNLIDKIFKSKKASIIKKTDAVEDFLNHDN